MEAVDPDNRFGEGVPKASTTDVGGSGERGRLVDGDLGAPVAGPRPGMLALDDGGDGRLTLSVS